MGTSHLLFGHETSERARDDQKRQRGTNALRDADSQRDLRRRLGVDVSARHADLGKVQHPQYAVHSVGPIRPSQLSEPRSSHIDDESRTRHTVAHNYPQRLTTDRRQPAHERASRIESRHFSAHRENCNRLCLATQQLRRENASRNQAALPFAPDYNRNHYPTDRQRLQSQVKLQPLGNNSLQHPAYNNGRANSKLSKRGGQTQRMGGIGVPRDRREIDKLLRGDTIEVRPTDESHQTKRPEDSHDGRRPRRVDQIDSPPVPKIALLIAAHNEAPVIQHTLSTAITAGMSAENIFVVDDNSTDATAELARAIVPKANVLSVERSGKGLAISKAARHFRLSKHYDWIHLADADGGFESNYFTILRHEITPESAAVTGYIKSMRGGIVSDFRTFEYTFGMEIVRRFQDITGTIPIIPGPTSCFRADVFKQLEFGNGALAEDFDVTLQIHRKQLGTIQFIEKAVVYTQDPITIKDFKRQILRWNKGILQGMLRHKIGTKLSRVDAYLMYQMGLSMAMVLNYFILLPIITVSKGLATTLPAMFLVDIAVLWLIVLYVASRAKRWDILSAFPHIYVMRWISLGMFVRSFVEVIILRRGVRGNGTWKPVTRQAA